MSEFIYKCPKCGAGLIVIKGMLTCPVCKHVGLTEKKDKK